MLVDTLRPQRVRWLDDLRISVLTPPHPEARVLKPTLVPLIALSLGFAAPACEPSEEPPPTEDQEPAPGDTTVLPPPDSLVETIGGDWIVRAKSGKACVSVPPSAIPGGDTLDVEIKLVTPPPVFPGVSEAFPPVYEFSVTDESGESAQFADSVVFAICVNFPGPRPDGAALARLASADSVEVLPYAEVPAACRLTCGSPPAPASTAWMEALFGGSPVTPTPAHAAVTEGLGGKGRGTSPFAGVVP